MENRKVENQETENRKEKTQGIENKRKRGIENKRKRDTESKRKKVQELDIFWRKVILFSVLFVIAVPLTFLIVRRFTKRTANFDSTMIMKEFEMDEGIGESFLEIKQATQELQEQLNTTTTESTSTDILLNTTTTEDY